jgi:hypothetical protein
MSREPPPTLGHFKGIPTVLCAHLAWRLWFIYPRPAANKLEFCIGTESFAHLLCCPSEAKDQVGTDEHDGIGTRVVVSGRSRKDNVATNAHSGV